MKPWEKAQTRQQQASTKDRKRREHIAERKTNEVDRLVGRKRRREDRIAAREAKREAKRQRESDRIDALVDGMVAKIREHGNVS